MAAQVPTVAEGPVLMLFDAEQARPMLLASLTVPSLDRSMASAAALVRQASPMPVEATALRDMLLSQMGLPRPLVEALDTRAPIGAAVVLVAIGAAPGVAVALTARSPELASRAAAEMGRTIARRGAALEIETPTGRKLWVIHAGSSLVLSDTAEALARGARLATDARRAADEDLTVVVYPDAIARQRGTDVKTGLAKMIQELRGAREGLERRGGGGPAAGGTDLGGQLMEGLLRKLGDAQTVELGLRLAEVQGVSVVARFLPRPGSALEKDAREVNPAVLDPALFGGDGLVGLFAGSYGPLLLQQADAYRAALGRQKGPGAGRALKLVEATLAAIDGRFSGAVRMKPHVDLEIVYRLKDRAAAGRLRTALLAADKATLEALLAAQSRALGAAEPQVTVKRETVGKLQGMHSTVDLAGKGVPSADQAAVERVFGRRKVDAYSAVAGDRLIVAVGANAKARLQALAGGAAGQARDREVSAALDTLKGRDGFGYFDPGPLIGLFATLSSDPRAEPVRGFRTPVPVYGGYGGDGQGKAVTFDLRLPPAAFVGVGAFAQTLMMGGARY